MLVDSENKVLSGYGRVLAFGRAKTGPWGRDPTIAAGVGGVIAGAGILNYNSCHPPRIRIMVHERSHWA